MYPYKLWFHCPLTIQKSVSQKSVNSFFFFFFFFFFLLLFCFFCFFLFVFFFYQKDLHITKQSTQNRSCRVKLRLKQMYKNDKTLSANWQVGMCQSSYIALSCKVSLLSRQRTAKGGSDCVDAQADLPVCCSHMTKQVFLWCGHVQINRSYFCRIRRKRFCCIQFYGEKKNKQQQQHQQKKKKGWFTIVGVIFFFFFFLHDRYICPTLESVSENQVKITI